MGQFRCQVLKTLQQGGWLNFHDPDQGVVMFRNRYQDDHDIVAGITATSKRIRGHQSYDNLGFRIVGLGSIWAIGAGRTGQIAGHTTLFPRGDISKMKGLPGILGVLEEFAFEDNGSGYAVATENCMGVLHHRRYFRVRLLGQYRVWMHCLLCPINLMEMPYGV
jgi:hypothetical protein